MVFDEIMPAILRGDVDAGVIIHEGRFTYRALGLHQVLDLGSWWERTTSLPLPLGAIVMRRALGASLAVRVEEAIRASLGHSRRHPEEAHHYVARHAQEMEPAVIDQHIATFVNDYTVNLGVEGEEAMRKLVEAACREAHTQAPALPLFRTQAC
jgi:1,4-dihydroxy-6-naphthoate synthase